MLKETRIGVVSFDVLSISRGYGLGKIGRLQIETFTLNYRFEEWRARF